MLVNDIMAHPHCKSSGQISGVTWPSGLVEQLKYSCVDDKPSDIVTSNEANWLRHPIWLNIGKYQRKTSQFCSL